MLDVIALIFLTRYIGKLAVTKGLKPITWKLNTIACWIIAEFIGIALGLFVLNSTDLLALSLLGLISGFGGFLFIYSILQKKPTPTADDDINRIGVDDLKP